MDDYFGVGESLEEQAFGEGLVAIGSHLLVRWAIILACVCSAFLRVPKNIPFAKKIYDQKFPGARICGILVID